MSLANNHIRDAGGQGLLQTITNIRKRGIEVSGAGKDLAAARKPAMLEAGGMTVAVLGYDAIAGYYHATADKIGSAPLTASIVRADIKSARAAGADLVIVFPHWGTEYRSKPFTGQQKLARMIIDSGADMVIGNHAHWAAAMEVYKGKPIWYALGNFVFDQTWSEPTMEGITLELTFKGAELIQATHATAHHPGPRPAELPRSCPRREGRHGPGLLGLEGAAALVRATVRRRFRRSPSPATVSVAARRSRQRGPSRASPSRHVTRAG